MKLFLNEEKRDKWVEEYIRKHPLVGVACGDFLPIPIYCATILGKINLNGCCNEDTRTVL